MPRDGSFFAMPYFSCLPLLACLALVCPSMAGEAIRLGQRVEIPVCFDGPEVLSNQMARICGDLQRVFAFPATIDQIFEVDATLVQQDAELREFAPLAYCGELWTGVICRISATSTNLLVTESLLAAYEDALDFATANSNLVMALDVLVSDINSGNVTNYGQARMKKLIWVAGETGSDDMVADALRGIENATFYPPSILDFRVGSPWGSQHTNVTATIHALGKGKPISEYQAIPMVFHNGFWGVLGQ